MKACPVSLVRRIGAVRSKLRTMKPKGQGERGQSAKLAEARKLALVAKKLADHGKCAAARRELAKSVAWARWSQGGRRPRGVDPFW